MDHEIVVFGGDCSERVFRTAAHITVTAEIQELDVLLKCQRIKACVLDCDLDYERAFDSIAKYRPELTVALCERLDFQRLVVATETARLQRIRVVAGLWRQSPLGILADMDQLIKDEAAFDGGTERIQPIPLPLQAPRHYEATRKARLTH